MGLVGLVEALSIRRCPEGRLRSLAGHFLHLPFLLPPLVEFIYLMVVELPFLLESLQFFYVLVLVYELRLVGRFA